LRGTFAPFFRASDNPIAIACFRLFTRPPLPPFPLLSVPRLRRRIALATRLLAAFPYRAMELSDFRSDVENCICSATHDARERLHATAITHEKRARSRAAHSSQTRQQHHDTARSRAARDKKLTGVELGEFGFFSGLRALMHLRIMLARFDRTVLIGT
jgi:hypothetical protein